MMHLGFSKSWPEALESMTGTPEMSATSFIKYFLPLYDFLDQENKANGECVGWGGENSQKILKVLLFHLRNEMISHFKPNFIQRNTNNGNF